jgi:large subunit ribosomal protein L21
MYAIVQAGGHQYRVAEGDTIDVQLPLGNAGGSLELREVLVVGDEGGVRIGKPFVDGAVVKATVVGETAGRKLTIFKYKPKNRYRIKTGHRQHYARLHIDGIEA